MNREQRRAAEKKVSKTTIDLTVEPPIVPDGVQFRVPVKTSVEGQDVTLCMAIVCVPFIYDNADSEQPGFVVKFTEDTERKVIGFDMSECLLMDIATVDEWKNCGIATILMKELQRMFKVIATGARSKAGYNLMLKCGFEATKEGQLIWKEADNAKEDGKSTEEAGEEKGAEG